MILHSISTLINFPGGRVFKNINWYRVVFLTASQSQYCAPCSRDFSSRSPLSQLSLRFNNRDQPIRAFSLFIAGGSTVRLYCHGSLTWNYVYTAAIKKLTVFLLTMSRDEVFITKQADSKITIDIRKIILYNFIVWTWSDCARLVNIQLGA